MNNTYLTTAVLAERVKNVRNETLAWQHIYAKQQCTEKAGLVDIKTSRNQKGHTTTTMLFKAYSRFITNLPKDDSSALEAFLQNGGQ